MYKFITFITVLIVLTLSAQAQRVVKMGDTIHNISLTSTKGDVYQLNKQSAKGFILVFTTPSCDHCLAYSKRISALNLKYKAQGFPVVAIGPYGDNEKDYPADALPAMRKLAEEKGFSFPYLADENFKFTWLFNIRQTPKAVILLKQNHSYRVSYIGAIDDQPNEQLRPNHKFVEIEVDKLLTNTPQ